MPAQRIDGRRPDQLRELEAQPGFLRGVPGSVLLSAGRTRLLCTASLESSVPNWMSGKGRGWLTAEYSMLPASTRPRKTRDGRRGGALDGRTVEIQRLIGRSLRAVVDPGRLGERTVWLDCDVLEADGGTRTLAVTGAWLALALGVREWRKRGDITADPILQPLAATSVGVVDGTPCLDLNYVEDSTAAVDMNVVMTGDGRFVEVQGTAEGAPFDRQALDGLLALAETGCRELFAWQQSVLGTAAQ